MTCRPPDASRGEVRGAGWWIIHGTKCLFAGSFLTFYKEIMNWMDSVQTDNISPSYIHSLSLPFPLITITTIRLICKEAETQSTPQVALEQCGFIYLFIIKMTLSGSIFALITLARRAKTRNEVRNSINSTHLVVQFISHTPQHKRPINLRRHQRNFTLLCDLIRCEAHARREDTGAGGTVLIEMDNNQQYSLHLFSN